MKCLLSLCVTLAFGVANAVYTFIDINNPVVQTTYGPVRGAKYQLSQTLSNRVLNQNILAFIGIPYGAPPTGVNRFKVGSFCCKKLFVKHLFFKGSTISGSRDHRIGLHKPARHVPTRQTTVPVITKCYRNQRGRRLFTFEYLCPSGKF